MSTTTEHSTQPDAPTSQHRNATITAGLLGALALLSALTPLSMDLYLPAFPSMAVDLTTTSTAIQLSLTAFMVGAGVGQVAFGILSDRHGRRVPLIVGTALFLVTSIAAAVAPSVGALIALRLLQGFGGAAGMVIGRAIIADRATGAAAARAQTLLMLVGGAAPVVAPLLGSFLTEALGWRGLLGTLAIIGAAAIVAVLTIVPETRPTRTDAPRPRLSTEVGQSLASLRNRRYVGYTLAFAFAFAVMMAYISASPFLYQEMIGLSTIGYGLAFGLNALFIMVASAISARLAHSVAPVRLATIGLSISLAATAVLGALVLAGTPAWSLALPLPIAIGALGLVFGTTTAMALDSARNAPGMASAALGLGQFILAGAVAPLVSVGGALSAGPMAVVMIVSALVALGSLHWAGRGAVTLDK